MPADLIDLNKRCSQTRFAALIGVSQPAIAAHVAAGTLRQGATLREWLQAMHRAMSEAKAGHAGELASQRARLAKEQADKIERQNAVNRGELIPAVQAFAVVARCNALINDRLLSLAKRVRLRSPNANDALIAEAEELAEYGRQILLTIPDQVLAELADSARGSGDR